MAWYRIDVRANLKLRRALELIAGILAVLSALTIRIIYANFKVHPASILCVFALLGAGCLLMEDSRRLTKRINDLG